MDLGKTVSTLSSSLLFPPASFELDVGSPVGDYVVTAKIGEGGMAEVYQAEHPLIGKRVAIKVISRALSSHNDAVERFLLEARCVSRLGVPNIVDIFNWGTLPDGRCYYVMEWLQGRPLSWYIDTEKLSVADKIEVLLQVCDALEAAHAHGVVHRDLKPDNIFLVPLSGGRKLVKLLDFGLAKCTTPASDNHRLTLTGVTMGTPAYVSPEQARGTDVDHRTDVYALGVVAYELFTGRLPFTAESVVDLLHKHINDAPQPPAELWPAIPRVLEALIVALLHKQASARPTLAATRAELAALRRSLDSGATPVAELSLPPPANRQRARSLPTILEHLHDFRPARMARSTQFSLGLLALTLLMGAAAVSLQAGGERRAGALPVPGAAAATAPVALAIPTRPAPAPAPAPAPSRAMLAVRVNVAGADLQLDGRRLGTGRAARVAFDSAGEHELVVKARGYRTYRTKVQVTPGRHLELDVELEKQRAPARPLASKGDFFTVDPWPQP